jgi:hypothetical protein
MAGVEPVIWFGVGRDDHCAADVGSPFQSNILAKKFRRIESKLQLKLKTVIFTFVTLLTQQA